MLIQEHYIDYHQSRLHYAKAGQGTIALLVFHGFGQDNQEFEAWVKDLGGKYRLYVFDLYFHGQSTWPSLQPLEKEDWQKIMSQFFTRERIEAFEIVGFSLGGKFALATLEAFPQRTRRIILLAADGIKLNTWYRLATYPTLTRRLFQSMVMFPGRYYALVKFFRRINLVNKGVVRFAESQMNTEEKRRRVYNSWVTFRHLKFDISQIADTLNQHQIPVLIIVGKYDKVIPAANMDRLVSRLHKKQFEVIEAGHNDVVSKAVKFML